jgi:hypothetical protein
MNLSPPDAPGAASLGGALERDAKTSWPPGSITMPMGLAAAGLYLISGTFLH